MRDKFDTQDRFINRELSWIEFNFRVLGEAQDSDNPLLERLKFLSIVCSNLDEFFMVRVGSLMDLINAGFEEPDPSGLTPVKMMGKILVKAHNMLNELYNCYNRSLKLALKKENISIIKQKDLNEIQKNYIDDYFIKNVYPVLTPMVVDQSRPFPLILNKTLNIAVLLKNQSGADNKIFATVQVPSVLDRLIQVPSGKGEKTFLLLEELIKSKIGELFSGQEIITSNCYRITRNADLTLDEEEAEDLLITIEESIKQRKWGSAVRLEVEKDMDGELIAMLENIINISKDMVFEIHGPIDLTFLSKLSGIKGYEHLRYKPIAPQIAADFQTEGDIFQTISNGDVLLHHPYQSFDPVVEMVRHAAADPDVLAIKQTLYRVSGNSPIIEALIKAAENGKQVTVLVELKARFDEQNNINWAKRLEQAGCHVIYGLVGLKTHCKILLIVRREEDGIKRYVHMGTGNYNDVTAKIYTDIGLFTASPYFASDASALFNMLSGHSSPTNLYKFSVAPLNLRQKFLSLIKSEIENALKGNKALIIAKMNSLVDKEMIEALYEASCSGVEIKLIVRGICCLRPGMKGISENIIVRSIIGRFLEHSRIFYFYSGGDESIYLSSADWMSRNLNRRVELLFPVDDERLKQRLKRALDIYLQDNVKARILTSEGTYEKADMRKKEQINCQEMFYDLTLKNAKDSYMEMRNLKSM